MPARPVRSINPTRPQVLKPVTLAEKSDRSHISISSDKAVRVATTNALQQKDTPDKIELINEKKNVNKPASVSEKNTSVACSNRANQKFLQSKCEKTARYHDYYNDEHIYEPLTVKISRSVSVPSDATWYE